MNRCFRSSWGVLRSQTESFQRGIQAVHATLPIRTLSSSSVSTTEVGKFSDLSKTWWDPRENPLIGMNSIRMTYITEQIRTMRSPSSASSSASSSSSPSSSSSSSSPSSSPSNVEANTDTVGRPLSGLQALDVGCGGGLLSESLARLGATVTAVDPSIKLVAAAQLHSQLDPRTRTIDYRGGSSVEELAAASSEDPETFDMICLLEVLEHVTDPDSILSAIRTLLKPEGALFLSTLNRTTKSHLVGIVGAEYIMRYLPVGTHDWNQFRSPEEVQSIMKRNGFGPVDVSGMVLNKPPLFGEWDWRLDPTDVDVNWIGTYQKSNDDSI